MAEAAALCSARRARSAPAAGGSRRRTASSSASPAPAKNSGSPSPALPLARAQAGIGAGGGKGLPFRGFRSARRRSRALAKRRRDALAQVVGEGGGEVWVGANHLAMVHVPRRFVSSFVVLSAPLVVVVAMSDKVALSDMIRSRPERDGKHREIRP